MKIYTLGLTAGASTPDVLIEEVIAAAKGRFDVVVEEVSILKTWSLTFRILQEAEEKVSYDGFFVHSMNMAVFTCFKTTTGRFFSQYDIGMLKSFEGIGRS